MHARTNYNSAAFDFRSLARARESTPREAQHRVRSLPSTLIYITVARTHCPALHNIRFVAPSAVLQRGVKKNEMRAVAPRERNRRRAARRVGCAGRYRKQR